MRPHRCDYAVGPVNNDDDNNSKTKQCWVVNDGDGEGQARILQGKWCLPGAHEE